MALDEYPSWQSVVTAAVIFFIGYAVGHTVTKNDFEKEIKQIFETNSISLNHKIHLGLTEAKRNEILDEMESIEEDRRQEAAADGYDPRR